jgi:hypothetical protein
MSARSSWLIVGPVLLGMSGSAGVMAQEAAPQRLTPFSPTLPPVTPVRELPPIATSRGTRPENWHFTVSGSGSWYENAGFTGPVLASTSWSTEGRATLSHDHRFRSGNFSISGFGGAIYYPEIDALSQPTYGGSLSLTLSPGRRQNTTVRVSQRYELTSTRYLRPADSEGVPLPTSQAEYATTAVGLEQRLGQSWQLALDAGYQYRSYDDVLLQDGQQVDGAVRLGHRVSRHGLMYLGYRYDASWFEENKERGHELLLGGVRAVRQGFGFELAAGVGYVESTQEYFPSARAGINATGRHARMALLYYRDFGQAYGYGRQTVGDVVAGVLSWSPADRLSISVQYDYGYRRDPKNEDYTIESQIASAGLGWRLPGGVGFTLSYGWERNETTGLPRLEGNRASATLSYGVGWR